MSRDPHRDVRSALHDQALADIERLADRAASYARSVGEAAYRGDATTVGMHLSELRACVVTMIGTWKETVRDAPGGPANGGGHDHRPSDGAA